MGRIIPGLGYTDVEEGIIPGLGYTSGSGVVCPNVTLVAYTSGKGDLTLNSDGSFTYDYTAGETTDTDSFTYRFTDDNGDSNIATVTLNITSSGIIINDMYYRTLLTGAGL